MCNTTADRSAAYDAAEKIQAISELMMDLDRRTAYVSTAAVNNLGEIIFDFAEKIKKNI